MNKIDLSFVGLVIQYKKMRGSKYKLYRGICVYFFKSRGVQLNSLTSMWRRYHGRSHRPASLGTCPGSAFTSFLLITNELQQPKSSDLSKKNYVETTLHLSDISPLLFLRLIIAVPFFQFEIEDFWIEIEEWL
jgi:hypothetical protein